MAAAADGVRGAVAVVHVRQLAGGVAAVVELAVAGLEYGPLAEAAQLAEVVEVEIDAVADSGVVQVVDLCESELRLLVAGKWFLAVETPLELAEPAPALEVGELVGVVEPMLLLALGVGVVLALI